jgi:hypothetical protein
MCAVGGAAAKRSLVCSSVVDSVHAAVPLLPPFTQSLNDLKQASALYLARVEMLKRLQAGAETLEIARSLELLGSTCYQL